MCVNAPHNCEIIDIMRERISRTGLRSTSFVATRTFKMSYKTVLDFKQGKELFNGLSDFFYLRYHHCRFINPPDKFRLQL